MKSEEREGQIDLRLGKMAVRKGLITPDQLKEALEEQRLGVQRGRKKPRRLGVILASRNLLTDDQVLELLEEQEALIQAQRRADDCLLGQILVDGGFATSENVAACLKIQEEAMREGADEIPLLGRLLVERGHATAEAIEEALELQRELPLDQEARPEPEPPPAPAPEALPAAPPELQRLGRYTIEGKLGRGAMGEVYEALDRQLNRKVALKVIRSELDAGRPGSSAEVDRFVQEARLAAKLSKHPHIVSVYEADVADGLHYIAMELIRGQTLAEWRKKGGLTLRQQVRILRSVALAVHYAHEHGVLHRDLKPGNVIVDSDQKAYVTDFGLARPHEPGTDASDAESRRVCGTPTYISPEQAQGLAGIDRRTDVYSLGVMLYETLEGHPPFREATRAATLKKVIHDPVPPFSSGGRARPFTTADRDIERICLKALAKKPPDRYPNAEALAKELAQWLDKKVSAAEAGPEGPRARFPIPLRIGAAVGVAALLLLAVIALRSIGPSVRKELLDADRKMKGGEYAVAFRLYDQAFQEDPSDAKARAGREEAKGKLVAAAVADLDRAMGDLEKARQELAEQAKRKAQTLDQEQRFADERRAAEEKFRAAEDRLKACREQVQTVMALGGK